MALLADDGRVHSHVTGQVRRDIVRRAERPPLLEVLNEPEACVVAALLDELAGVYPDEQLGRLGRTMAVRLYDRLGI
jgi:glutamate/tyrosine decarboxylase-like PLP-dependent enzyme